MKTYLTYDYELFAGNACGSVTNCLVTPLKDILNILDKHQIKATFFVDAALLYRLNELRHLYHSIQDQWKIIEDNIKLLNHNGHDIELHIHPQWFYSNYNGISWNIDLKHFKLSDLDREDVDLLVERSHKLLESIVSKKIHAFRAGGYSIQGLHNYNLFYKEHDIYLDSSVLSGLKYFSEHQQYDYSNIPSKSLYRFSADITKEDATGFVTEVPITTLAVSRIQYIGHLIFRKLHSRLLSRAGDGNAILPSKNSLKTRMRRVLSNHNHIPASFDDANGKWIKMIFDLQFSEGKDMVVISHPKLHTKYSARIMDEFLSYAKGKTEFCTIDSLYK